MIEGDVPPLGPNIGISPKRSPSWHCVAAEHTLDLLMEGLADAALFDNARFDTIDSITSLAKAKLHPGIKSILAALEDAGLTPQLGHNPSSGRVAFTMPLPVRPPPSNKQKHPPISSSPHCSAPGGLLSKRRLTIGSSSAALDAVCRPHGVRAGGLRGGRGKNSPAFSWAGGDCQVRREMLTS